MCHEGTHRALSQARYTAVLEQCRCPRKVWGQGSHDPTEIGDGGPDINCACDPECGRGTHLTEGIGEEDIRDDLNITPPSSKGVRHDLAATCYDKLSIDGDITRVTAPTPHAGGDLAVLQLDHPPCTQFDSTPSCPGGLGSHGSILAEECLSGLELERSGGTVAYAAGRNRATIAELDVCG